MHLYIKSVPTIRKGKYIPILFESIYDGTNI